MSTRIPKEGADYFRIVMPLEHIKYWNKLFYENNESSISRYMDRIQNYRYEHNYQAVNLWANLLRLSDNMIGIRNMYMNICINDELELPENEFDSLNPDKYTLRYEDDWLYDHGSTYDQLDELNKASFRDTLSLKLYEHLN